MRTARIRSRYGIPLLLLLTGAPALAAETLTLERAEALALERAPWLAHHRTNIEAAVAGIEYEGQLPDPQLLLGAQNVPVESWSLDEDPMTMKIVGLRQAFPPGATRSLRAERATHGVAREGARLDLERRDLRLQVRRAWLELFYAEAGLRVLASTRALTARELESTENRYRAAQETQRSVLRARQALARVNEREPMLRALAARQRAQIARWIGPEALAAELPDTLPALDALPAEFDITRHPAWQVTATGREVARTEVGIQRQEYKPGVMVDVMYGFRDQESDMVTALVSVDLPIFQSKRQDQKLAEKEALALAANYEVEDKRRELEAMYAAARAEHQAAIDRARIYTEQLLPAIRREAQISLAGYAREQSDIREARMKELDAQLELLRAQVDAARAKAELLYLMGDSQP